jgi:hypothetical protein
VTYRPVALIAVLAFSSSVVVAACVEEPSRQGESHRTPANGSTQQAPVAIGREGDVPQVHLPPRLIPPRVATARIALSPTAALTRTPDGGALLLWSSVASAPRPVSQLALRAIDPHGVPGPIWELRRTPGTVRGIDIAMRGDQAMMIWNADVGGIASQIFAERVRTDGTLVGSPFGIGTYRVTIADGPDAGANANAPRLGFPARVLPSPLGFAVAVRGVPARCGTASCPTVRVAEIDAYDVITGRGGLQGNDPSGDVVFVGAQDVPWTLAVTFGGGNAPAHIETFGSGPLSRLGLRAGELVAAWVHDGDAHAIVRRGDALEIVNAASAGEGGANRAIVQRTSFECIAQIPAVRLTGPLGSTVVRADDPGGTDVIVWAMNTPPTAASPRNARGPRAPMAANLPAMAGDPVSDVTAIAAGLLVARASRLEVARCDGDTLAAPAAIPWEPPTIDATAP